MNIKKWRPKEKSSIQVIQLTKVVDKYKMKRNFTDFT